MKKLQTDSNRNFVTEPEIDRNLTTWGGRWTCRGRVLTSGLPPSGRYQASGALCVVCSSLSSAELLPSYETTCGSKVCNLAIFDIVLVPRLQKLPNKLLPCLSDQSFSKHRLYLLLLLLLESDTHYLNEGRTVHSLAIGQPRVEHVGLQCGEESLLVLALTNLHVEQVGVDGGVVNPPEPLLDGLSCGGERIC